MVSIGTPTVYHFHTSVKIPENPNNKILSEKKRLLVKWANAEGVSYKHLNYIWDHIIGDIVASKDNSINVITTEIKDLRLTVESLKATIDELVASNKYMTMKLMEQEKNYVALINKKIPDVENNMENYSNTTYDSDYSPPQKVFKKSSKKSKNKTIRPSLELRDDVDDIDEELAETYKFLKQLNDDSNAPDVIQPLVAVNERSLDNFKEKPPHRFPVVNEAQFKALETSLAEPKFGHEMNIFLLKLAPKSEKLFEKTFRSLIPDSLASKMTFTGTTTKRAFGGTLLESKMAKAWSSHFPLWHFKKMCIFCFKKARCRERMRVARIALISS